MNGNASGGNVEADNILSELSSTRGAPGTRSNTVMVALIEDLNIFMSSSASPFTGAHI